MKRSRHRRLRAKAWASRWRWPLILGGSAAILALINARTASGATAGANPRMPLLPGPAGLPMQSGTQTIPELPGAEAPTATQINTAAGFWNTLTPGDSLTSGYLNFPSGAQSAAALFPIRYDGYGSPYTQWAGKVFILTGPDASGNYTATQIQL